MIEGSLSFLKKRISSLMRSESDSSDHPETQDVEARRSLIREALNDLEGDSSSNDRWSARFDILHNRENLVDLITEYGNEDDMDRFYETLIDIINEEVDDSTIDDASQAEGLRRTAYLTKDSAGHHLAKIALSRLDQGGEDQVLQLIDQIGTESESFIISLTRQMTKSGRDNVNTVVLQKLLEKDEETGGNAVAVIVAKSEAVPIDMRVKATEQIASKESMDSILYGVEVLTELVPIFLSSKYPEEVKQAAEGLLRDFVNRPLQTTETAPDNYPVRDLILLRVNVWIVREILENAGEVDEETEREYYQKLRYSSLIVNELEGSIEAAGQEMFKKLEVPVVQELVKSVIDKFITHTDWPVSRLTEEIENISRQIDEGNNADEVRNYIADLR